MEKQEKQKCLKCGRGMPLIGRNSANGKGFLSGANYNFDWEKRKYHKKCWKLHQEDIQWKQRYLKTHHIDLTNKTLKS